MVEYNAQRAGFLPSPSSQKVQELSYRLRRAKQFDFKRGLREIMSLSPNLKEIANPELSIHELNLIHPSLAKASLF